MWWTVWAACAGAPDCERTEAGACVPVVDDDVDGDGSPVGEDCDDSDATLAPVDRDGDGWTSCQGDCADDPSDPDAVLRGPRGAVPDDVLAACDNVDNDCDGVVDEGDLGPACLVTTTFPRPRWSQLDLVIAYDTSASFALTSLTFERYLLAFLQPFAGTDTRLAVIDTRDDTGQLLALEDQRWLSLQGRTAAEAEAWVRGVIGEAVYTSDDLQNRPLSQAVALQFTANDGFLRGTGTSRLAVLATTISDEQYLVEGLFRPAFDGELYTLGPSPICGGAEGPVLREATSARRYAEACDDAQVTEVLARAAEDLVPAEEIRLALGDVEIRPATLEGELERADGVRVPLGPAELVHLPETNEVLVPASRWLTTTAVTLRYQRVPDEIVAGEDPPG